MPEHLDRLRGETSVVPAVNQIELHPYFQQTALQQVHAEHGIVTQAWSPIGGITCGRPTSSGASSPLRRGAGDRPSGGTEPARRESAGCARVALALHVAYLSVTPASSLSATEPVPSAGVLR